MFEQIREERDRKVRKNFFEFFVILNLLGTVFLLPLTELIREKMWTQKMHAHVHD